MANPLMRAMLNNILVKEGKQKASNTIQWENKSNISNLRKEQVSSLLTNVLHRGNGNSHKTNETKMLTLEELRKPNSTNTPQASQDRPSLKAKPMVSLISIGKSNRT